MSENIYVELCHDHFERLVKGETCHTCPSRVENEAAVRALSAMKGKSHDDKMLAVVNEIHSIRRTQKDALVRLQRICDRVDGNGRPGHDHRLTVIETRMQAAEKNKASFIAIVTAMASAVLTIISMILKTLT
jgi:hypothetical protein